MQLRFLQLLCVYFYVLCMNFGYKSAFELVFSITNHMQESFKIINKFQIQSSSLMKKFFAHPSILPSQAILILVEISRIRGLFIMWRKWRWSTWRSGIVTKISKSIGFDQPPQFSRPILLSTKLDRNSAPQCQPRAPQLEELA